MRPSGEKAAMSPEAAMKRIVQMDCVKKGMAT